MDANSFDAKAAERLQEFLNRTRVLLAELETGLVDLKTSSGKNAGERLGAVESPEALFAGQIQTDLGRRAAESMDYINSAMALLEKRMADAGKKSEAVTDLLLAIEQTRRQAGEIEVAAEKLKSLEKAFISLSGRLSGAEGSLASINHLFEKSAAGVTRLESALLSAAVLNERLESLAEKADILSVGRESMLALEKRTAEMISAFAARENGLSDVVASAGGAADRLGPLVQAGLSAGKNLEEQVALLREKPDYMEVAKRIESKISAFSRSLDEVDERITVLAARMAEMDVHESRLAELSRKVETASGMIAAMDAGFASIGQMEERMAVLRNEIMELKYFAERTMESVSQAADMQGLSNQAQARAAELIDKMDSAEERLAATGRLERTLSMLEGKTFEIIQRLDAIESSRVAAAAQEKIDHLQALMNKVDAKLNRLFP